MNEHVSDTDNGGSTQLGINHLVVKGKYEAWTSVTKNVGMLYKRSVKSKEFNPFLHVLSNVLIVEYSDQIQERTSLPTTDLLAAESAELFNTLVTRCSEDLSYEIDENNEGVKKKFMRVVNSAVEFVNYVQVIKPKGSFFMYDEGTLFDPNWHKSRERKMEIDFDSLQEGECYCIRLCAFPSYSVENKHIFVPAGVCVDKVQLESSREVQLKRIKETFTLGVECFDSVRLELVDRDLNLLYRSLFKEAEHESDQSFGENIHSFIDVILGLPALAYGFFEENPDLSNCVYVAIENNLKSLSIGEEKYEFDSIKSVKLSAGEKLDEIEIALDKEDAATSVNVSKGYSEMLEKLLNFFKDNHELLASVGDGIEESLPENVEDSVDLAFDDDFENNVDGIEEIEMPGTIGEEINVEDDFIQEPSEDQNEVKVEGSGGEVFEDSINIDNEIAEAENEPDSLVVDLQGASSEIEKNSEFMEGNEEEGEEFDLQVSLSVEEEPDSGVFIDLEITNENEDDETEGEKEIDNQPLENLIGEDRIKELEVARAEANSRLEERLEKIRLDAVKRLEEMFRNLREGAARRLEENLEKVRCDAAKKLKEGLEKIRTGLEKSDEPIET